jgi:3-hydroxyisobutyrate dehydrogenase-like beta-hydroxyacid dehydrogenase
MKVGFIGLGQMGRPMAANLKKAGHELIAYNRTRAKAEQLGARVANTPADAARDAEVVVTMLADDEAVKEVVFGADGLASTLRPGAIHVSMSTISVALSQELAEEHREHKQEYVAAPVFGRPQAAEAAKLFVVVAGEPGAVKKCEPLFEAMGQRTFPMGDEAPKANVVKLSGNFLIASVIETLGEALSLVRKYDIDPEKYVEMLTSTLFVAPVYKTYADLIVKEQFEPAGFRLKLGLKDVRLALAAAEAQSVPMPVASVIRDHALEGVANGMGDKDWSSLAQVVSNNAGLNGRS